MTGNAEYQKINVLGGNEIIDPSKQIIMVESAAEDEISLIDLYLVLAKHKKIMAIVIVAIVMLGVAFALAKPKVFNYSMSIQIGKMLLDEAQGDSLQPIESSETVLSKITESYIPSIVNQYVEHNPDGDIPVIKARIPKGSNIIIVESKVPESEILQVALIQSVVARVIDDHKPFVDVVKSQYATALNNAQITLVKLQSPVSLQVKLKPVEVVLLQNNVAKRKLGDPQLNRVRRQKYKTEIQSHENKLLSLADESSYLALQMKRLEELDKMLEQQILTLSGDIEQALINRKVSIAGVNDPSMAMTALLLDNQLQSDRKRMNDLQERLTVQQQNLREKLANDIKKNNRAIEYQKTLVKDLQNSLLKMNIDDENKLTELDVVITEKQVRIQKLKFDQQMQIERQQQIVKDISIKLDSLDETRALTDIVKSTKPVGPGSKLIVAISLVVGVFLAVFTAFALEFMDKVKQKTSQSEV